MRGGRTSLGRGVAFGLALAACGAVAMACSRAPTPPPGAAAALVARWERDAGEAARHRLTFLDDGRFTFEAYGPKLPVSRAMGRWTRTDDGLVLEAEAHEPPARPFPYGGAWTGLQGEAGPALRASVGSRTLEWRRSGPADDSGLWHVVPPDGAALLQGTLTIARPGAPAAEVEEIDVLGVYYYAANHPYLELETVRRHRLTLYEAPSTDRVSLTVDPALLAAAGVEGTAQDAKYGAYVPLASLEVDATPATGLRTPPLTALKLRGLPVAKLSGPGLSRGDRPEDALLLLGLDIALTRDAGLDPRAPGLVGRVPAP